MNKKFTFGRLAACLLTVMAMLPMAVNAEDCAFIPNLFPGQAADRTATEVSATVHVGEWGPQNGYDNTHLINSLTSSNTTAVKVYSNGGYNAAVYFDSVGTADVMYTETIQRSSCTGVDQTIHYTVAKGTPTIYFAGQDGASQVTEYTVAWSQGGGGGDAAGGGADEGGGSSVWTPSCIARYQSLYDTDRGYRFVNTSIAKGELTFNSTNPAVATINANGVTTVVGYGSTTISVSWPGNANWEAGNASYTLYVKKVANIYFSPSLMTDTAGNVRHLTVNCPQGVTIDRWQSMTPEYATVDNAGNVTLLKSGAASIRAYFDGNAEYAPAVCACQINIEKRKPHIAFDQPDVYIEVGAEPYEFAHLMAPEDITGNFTWQCLNANVASINPTTGEITVYGEEGNAKIFCLYGGDAKYLKDTAEYWLHVTTSGVWVNGALVSSANPDVLGNGSLMYTVDPMHGKFLTFNNLNYVGTNGNFIEASKPVNILVKGSCSISNVSYAITSSSSVFLWCENNKDTISIDARFEAINAGSLKVHDCYLFATAGLYAINTQSAISVSAGGYIFAEATGQNLGGKGGTPEAIRADHFIKGEDGIGGINVLTQGVTFHDSSEGGAAGTGGFFTNYHAGTRAMYVEIGKIPLPLEDDEVKDIAFTEDPHDNLDVVFSESGNDTFNETKQQIEIKTITADGQITTASAYVTCSSEWLKLLPGVLVFDIPAGEGEVAIQYELAEGFILQAQIEGVGSASISWANPGWAKLQYNVAQQTHVIIYLQSTSHASAPAKAPAHTSALTSGAAIKAIKITPSELNKYYVVGTFNSWTFNESYRLTLNSAAAPTEEYMIELPLTTTDQFKVKMDAETPIWYPDGVDNNYGQNGEITEDGNYTIYFRPNGDGGYGWFYNVIYVEKQSPSAIEETNADPKAAKFIRNGQLFIEKNGKTYNAIGIEIK